MPDHSTSSTASGPAGVALILIDLQIAYFADDALRTQHERLRDAANALVDWARCAGVPVVNVRTEHARDRSTWTLSMLEDDQGFAFVGDDDAQSLDGLDPAGSIDVVKTRDDAFLGTRLAAVLDERGVGTLVVAGVSTHTCVALTAAHAYARGMSVVLVHDAIASHRPALHRPTLATLAEEYRFPVVDVAALLVAGVPGRG